MDIENILRTHKKSITEERKDIFSFIEKRHIFWAQEILDHFPDLWRASVFRTIRLFLEIGILRRLILGNRGETYEINRIWDHHEHMKCRICEDILNFDSGTICQKIFEEAKKQGFIIQEHSLSIIGKCQKCTSL